MTRPTLLNVAGVVPRTRANGPGLRAAVWVQGCTRGCRGCFNPETHAHRAARLLDPEALAAQLAATPDLEGLSLLGGEPFEQARCSARLAAAARRRGLSIITWTGYPAAWLSRSTLPEVQALIAASDVLVAGPYRQAQREPRPRLWGSANQEVVHLTSRYTPEMLSRWSPPQAVEVVVSPDGVTWTGPLGPGDRDGLEAATLA